MKHDRIATELDKLGKLSDLPLDRCYLGYFAYFNDSKYYEAHDVLEQLWLKTRDENNSFYKGLIQLAGAFVHLRKQHLRPDHRVDGRRLQPAMRLFKLAEKNLLPYRPHHLHCDVDSLCRLCARFAGEIEESNFSRNPWNPAEPPQLILK